MPQTEVHPIKEGCKYLRGRYKLQPSRKSPIPERRFVRYECGLGHEIGSDEDIEQCLEQRIECWRVKREASEKA